MRIKNLKPGDKFTFEGDSIACVVTDVGAVMTWFEVVPGSGFKQWVYSNSPVDLVKEQWPFSPRTIETESRDEVTISTINGTHPVQFDATSESDMMTSASARELAAALIAAADWSDADVSAS